MLVDRQSVRLHGPNLIAVQTPAGVRDFIAFVDPRELGFGLGLRPGRTSPRELERLVFAGITRSSIVLLREVRVRPKLDPDVRLEPALPPAEPIPDVDPVLDDPRALFITRCDAELGPEGVLAFSYLIRGLSGRPVQARILGASSGALLHEWSLPPAATADRVHDASWDARVTLGSQAGQRVSAPLGPCVLELVHDKTYRDVANFRVLGASGFEVRVLDPSGEPVADLDLEFLLDGQATIVRSGPDGLARHEGSEAAQTWTAGLRLAAIDEARALLEPRWAESGEQVPPEPSADVLHVCVESTWQGATLDRGRRRTLVLLPSIVRVRLEGMHFDTSKCFLLPGAMRGIARLREIYAELSEQAEQAEQAEAKVVVCGHTDGAGTKRYNLDLSLERAESIIAYLTDDVDAWAGWFADDRDADKRWGTPELQHMLRSLPSNIEAQSDRYYAGAVDGKIGSGTRAGVERFQADQGLPVSGELDESTRRALIREYMGIDGTTLPEGVEIEPHACGELFLEGQAGQASADEASRRVDVFLFEGAVSPPSPGPWASEGEREYPAWRDRARVTHVLDADAPDLGDTNSQIHVFLRSNSGSVPLRDRPYRVDVDGQIHEGVSDGEGLVCVDEIRSGDYELEVEGVRTIIPTRPRGAASHVHVVAGYYLLPPT